ncbi:putative MFS transporter [Protomyces lactucae-debilis]|uniref:Putative MFS transporter n=1 Tax=Protomyces lactucae-debilis TaxID=2754530 RepID=A0A1Y2FC79_PROLT|nr:putative MFS transporter [Protomyces lactucae-debilis]ORY81511.1 putative MFS transporter [Protomyces lactucae-debilis]
MKAEARHEESVDLAHTNSDEGKPYLADHVPFTPEEEKKLLRKIDLRLIPWLSFLYLLSFLDRANIGNARLQGLEKSLGLKDQQYLWALTIFFFPYAAAEPACNILLKGLKPHVWFTAIIVAWAIVMTCMSAMTNYSGILAARFFLGLTEAGLFPGVNYYLSCWYKRNELGLRMAVFFSAATASGAFGGLLAAGIGKLDGKGGMKGWQWLFLLEGIATVFAGAASWWLIQDFPDTAKFLTERERAQVIWRLQRDQQKSAAGEGFSVRSVLRAFFDVKVLLACVIYIGCLGPLYAFSLFLPTIISTLGYSGTTAQLYSVAPYVVAAFGTICLGYIGDRFGYRSLLNMLSSTIAIIGFALLLGERNKNIQYLGTFLGALGVYPTIPLTISLFSGNLEGSYKRGVAIGIFISAGNFQGAVSSNIFRAKDKPRYILGHSVVIGYLCLVFFGSFATFLYLRWEMAARRAGKRNYRIEGKSQHEIDQLGDLHPDFVYQY